MGSSRSRLHIDFVDFLPLQRIKCSCITSKPNCFFATFQQLSKFKAPRHNMGLYPAFNRCASLGVCRKSIWMGEVLACMLQSDAVWSVTTPLTSMRRWIIPTCCEPIALQVVGWWNVLLVGVAMVQCETALPPCAIT